MSAVLIDTVSRESQRPPIQSGFGRKWLLARKLKQALGPLQIVRHEVKVARNAREAALNRRAQTEVKSLEELDKLPFWMQGDAHLNTDSAIHARAQLRRHPAIMTQLQLWWETAQRSMQQGRGSGYVASTVTRDEYIKVSRLLSKAMMEQFSPVDAQRAAEEDFDIDAAGGETLSREQFMDAIFE
jgi:hypothetical protein